MNIGQIARQQQMMYRFVNRGSSNGYSTQMNSQLAALGGFNTAGKSGNTDAAGLLQSMGFSGLEGRTAREMAQYQMRVQEKQSAAPAQQLPTGVDTASMPQRFSVREQYTPISDEATRAMQNLALEDAKNSIGTPTADRTARANLIRDQLKDVDPSKRAAAFNTMNKVWESEMDRIGSFIKEKDSSWTNWGDKFDTAVLDDYKAGVNVWV